MWWLLNLFCLFCLLLPPGTTLCDAQLSFVRTIAGNAAVGMNPQAANDGAMATTIVGRPTSIALDPNGILHFTETSRVRRINADGTLQTIANVEKVCFLDGDGGPAELAGLCSPNSITFDSEGTLYIADTGNSRIRSISPQGIIRTLAGTSVRGFQSINVVEDVPATSTTFYFPTSLIMDNAGNLLVGDRASNRIRKIDTVTGIVTTLLGVSGSGYAGPSVPLSSNPSIQGIAGMTFDSMSNVVYFVEEGACVVRKVENGQLLTIAGTGGCSFSGDNGLATNAALNFPKAILFSSNNVLYIADNYRLRAVVDGIISTVAGVGIYSWSIPPYPVEATTAYFGVISALAELDGSIFMSDSNYNNVYVYYPANATIRLLFGNSMNQFFPISPTPSILRLSGMFVWNNTLYFSDPGYNMIRGFDLISETFSDVAGNGMPALSGDGGPATLASLHDPQGIFITPNGKLYFADTNNGRVRMIDLQNGGNMSAVAGTRTVGLGGFNGDDLPPQATQIKSPYGVVVDTVGAVYVADTMNYRVRKINNNIVTTIAGNGTNSFDDNPTSSPIFAVYGMALDTQGNLYLAMQLQNQIGFYNSTTGSVSRLVGNGLAQLGGDGGPCDKAFLNSPRDLHLDSVGYLYIADAGNGRVRKVDLVTKQIETILGFGSLGKAAVTIKTGGFANQTSISNIPALLGDNNGNMFLVDKYASKVFQIDSSGIVSNIFGITPGSYYVDELLRTSGALLSPAGIAYRNSTGEMFLSSESWNNVVSVFRTVNNIAGSGDTLNDGGKATMAKLSAPSALWLDSTETALYIADSGQFRIRKVDLMSNNISTFAGSGSNGDGISGAMATSSSIGSVFYVTGDSAGNLYLSDRTFFKVRRVGHDGILTTIAGTGVLGYNGDNIAATTAQLNGNSGLWVDSDGALFIADTSNNRVRKVSLDGIISTFAGNGGTFLTEQSMPATSSTLYSPTSLWGDSSRNIFISEVMNFRVRKVDKFGWMTTFAGWGAVGMIGIQTENVPATSSLARRPMAITGDPAGNIYFVDLTNNRIRKIFNVAYPTSRPSRQPSRQPSSLPSFQPSKQPLSAPTSQPSTAPTLIPSSQPSVQPSLCPSTQPRAGPSAQPSQHPTSCPSTQPRAGPSAQPSQHPTSFPSSQPSTGPTAQPSCVPTNHPSWQPISHPSLEPSACPTNQPSVRPTLQPVSYPSLQPIGTPSSPPVAFPSGVPSVEPSSQPFAKPTAKPIASPSAHPASRPSATPSGRPSVIPSRIPTQQPSSEPSVSPTRSPIAYPTYVPSCIPTSKPSAVPSCSPLAVPTAIPTSTPTSFPTQKPSGFPTSIPSSYPSVLPSPVPSRSPLIHPTGGPSSLPTPIPSDFPSVSPTVALPTYSTTLPSSFPSMVVLTQPSSEPTSTPSRGSVAPSSLPTPKPSEVPTTLPTSTPSAEPSAKPTLHPSISPTSHPTVVPSMTVSTSSSPTSVSSAAPFRSTNSPSTPDPTLLPSHDPTLDPTETPSHLPSVLPSVSPSYAPTFEPTSSVPSSLVPSRAPTVVPTTVAPSHDPSATTVPTAVSPVIVRTPSPTVMPTVAPTLTPSIATYNVAINNATFSIDGSTVGVSFLGETTRLGLAVRSFFNCSSLLSFPCAAKATCMWISNSDVTVDSTGAACLKVGSPMKLVSSALRAKLCPLGSSSCTSLLTTDATVSVLGPRRPLTPSIVTSLPTNIGMCSSLLLDGTTSSGSLGRDWSSFEWSISSPNQTSADKIQRYINATLRASLPFVIPHSLLESGATYTVSLSACNFLGACATTSSSVAVGGILLPIVSIASGGSNRTVVAANSVGLSASASLPSCTDGFNKAEAMRYEWKIFPTGSTTPLEAKSVSRDPSKFVLPPYSLRSSTAYRIEVTASTSSSAAVQAITTVVVASGRLIPVIAGFAKKQVRFGGDKLVIDASASYDENEAIPLGLSFRWSCFVVGSASPCGAMFDNTLLQASSTNPKLELVALPSATANTQISLRLLLSDTKTTRNATSSVFVDIVPALTPVVLLTSSPTTAKLNAGNKLQLTAAVDVPSGLQGNLSWVISCESFPVFLPNSSATVRFAAAPSSRTLYHFLSVPASMFLPGKAYSFSLQAAVASPGRWNRASLEVQINAPPTVGMFAVSPTSGIALKDYFQYACAQWRDDDLPLLYQFGYMPPSSVSKQDVILLRSPSEATFTSVQLPAGNLSLIANVFDSMSASTQATFHALVDEESFTSDALTAYIVSTLTLSQQSNNADEIRQSTALASYLLNKANCSLAPNCTDLHRLSCSTASHTCGACLSDLYVGQDGPSNDVCLPHGSAEKRNKTCTANCFGHGTCRFVSLQTAEYLRDCLVGDTNCAARCVCHQSYRGTANCELEDSELASRIELREHVIASLVHLPSLEEASVATVETWISAMKQASQKPEEVSLRSSEMTMNFTLQVLQSFESAHETPTTSILSLFETVSFVFEQEALQLKNHPDAATPSVMTVADERAWSFLDGLNSFGMQLAESKLPGDPLSASVDSRFQVLSASLSPQAATDNTTVVLPKASEEEDSTSITLPTSTAQQTSAVQVVVSSMSRTLFANLTLASSLLSVQSSEAFCAGCVTRFTLPRHNTASASLERFNLTCIADQIEELSHQCRSGDIFHKHCDGEAEMVSGVCPFIDIETSCVSMDDASFQSAKECNIIAETKTNITCECVAPQGGRRLQATANQTAPAVYAVNYAVLAKTVYRTFVTTTLSARNQNIGTAKDGKEVIATLGSLITCIVAAILLSMYADAVEEEQHRKVAPDDKAATSKRRSFASSMFMRPTFSRFSSLFAHQVAPSMTKVSNNARQAPKSLLQVAEEALPSVLSSKSFSARFSSEMKRHHRWFAVFFYYSPKFPRAYRVIALATNIVIMLFMQSITYNLTKGDDGSCATFHTETDCLSRESAYSTGAAMCRWDAARSSCSFVPPDSDLEVIIFVAIFSAIVSTPIALVADWVIQHVLAAPTITVGGGKADSSKTVALQDSELLQGQHADLRKSIAIVVQAEREGRRKRNLTMTHKANNKLHSLRNTQQEFRKLQLHVKEYRDHIFDPKERDEFDDIWGLDEEGNFLRVRLRLSNILQQHQDALEQGQLETVSKVSILLQQTLTCFAMKEKSFPVADLITMELQKLQQSYEEEQQRFATELLNEKEKGKRLLFLFQKDLLPGISGEILEAKDRRDNIVIRGKSMTAKWLGVLFLLLLNGFMLFYIFLFASVQDNHRQNAWAQSFAIWLLMEILVVSSFLVLLMNVFIPSLIMKDIDQVRRRLVQSVEQYQATIVNTTRSQMLAPKDAADNENSSSSSSDDEAEASKDGRESPEHQHQHHYHGFNAAKYLFLSYKVAALYPELRVSKMIQAFSTPWPKQSYHRASDVAKNYSRKFTTLFRSGSMVVIFFVTSFLSGPTSIQDMIMSILSTLVIGYVILLHLQLYTVFPALIIVPALLLGVIAHFVYSASKSSTAAANAVQRRGSTVQVADMAKQICDHNHTEPPLANDAPALVVHKTRRDSVLEGVQVAQKAHEALLESHVEEDGDELGSVFDSKLSSDSTSLPRNSAHNSDCSDDSDSSNVSFMSFSSASSAKHALSASYQPAKAAKLDVSQVIYEDLHEDARSRCQSFQK